KRSAQQTGTVASGLTRYLGNAMEYLHQRMEREKDTNVNLASGVKVFIEHYVDNKENDTGFYDPERPLNSADFKLKPQHGICAASVFPSFFWEAKSEVVEGFIHLNIQTKVYMLKSSSWVREGSRNAYGLNHEQRHFDLVKLVVERFKKKLLAMEFSPQNHDSMLGYYYL